MELSVQHSRTLRVTHSNLKIWDKPKGEKSRTRLKIVVIRLYEGAQIRLSFFSRKRRISAQSFLNLKSIFKNTCITSRQQICNTRPINERARGHTKNFVMTLTDFSRREKSSRESMQGEKGALCWVICSCMKHFTAKPEHYKCLLQIAHQLYTCVLRQHIHVSFKISGHCPYTWREKYFINSCCFRCIGLHLPTLTLNVIWNDKEQFLKCCVM